MEGPTGNMYVEGEIDTCMYRPIFQQVYVSLSPDES